jgi:hypothetical protein
VKLSVLPAVSSENVLLPRSRHRDERAVFVDLCRRGLSCGRSMRSVSGRGYLLDDPTGRTLLDPAFLFAAGQQSGTKETRGFMGLMSLGNWKYRIDVRIVS